MIINLLHPDNDENSNREELIHRGQEKGPTFRKQHFQTYFR